MYASPAARESSHGSGKLCRKRFGFDVTSSNDVFAAEPIRIDDRIPVFSETDPYSQNYERIAADHLRSLAKDGINPWIAERLWTAMEASTIRLIEKYAQAGDAILDVGVG